MRKSVHNEILREVSEPGSGSETRLGVNPSMDKHLTDSIAPETGVILSM